MNIIPPTFPKDKASIPTTIPTGTVRENSKQSMGLRSARYGTFLDVLGKTEIRTPSERPSKSWWNDTAVRRDAKKMFRTCYGLEVSEMFEKRTEIRTGFHG